MERFLAIQIKRIGDLILTAPALGRLRRARPEAEIVLAGDFNGRPDDDVVRERPRGEHDDEAEDDPAFRDDSGHRLRP